MVFNNVLTYLHTLIAKTHNLRSLLQSARIEALISNGCNRMFVQSRILIQLNKKILEEYNNLLCSITEAISSYFR